MSNKGGNISKYDERHYPADPGNSMKLKYKNYKKNYMSHDNQMIQKH